MQLLLHRHVGIKRRVLAKVADRPFHPYGIADDFGAVNPDFAAVKARITGNNVHERTLAGAIYPEQPYNFPCGKMQGNIPQDCARAILLCQRFDCYHRLPFLRRRALPSCVRALCFILSLMTGIPLPQNPISGGRILRQGKL